MMIAKTTLSLFLLVGTVVNTCSQPCSPSDLRKCIQNNKDVDFFETVQGIEANWINNGALNGKSSESYKALGDSISEYTHILIDSLFAQWAVNLNALLNFEGPGTRTTYKYCFNNCSLDENFEDKKSYQTLKGIILEKSRTGKNIYPELFSELDKINPSKFEDPLFKGFIIYIFMMEAYDARNN